jgi:catechol 2,3-dioxygenase-like lactoylglutathione lyase family enzyme
MRQLRLGLGLSALLLVGAASAWHFGVAAADKPAASEFASTTIDLGVVTQDVEKSVKFYTDVIGFKEAKGFSVPGDFCKDAGLTDSKPLNVRVLVLGEGASATKLKLMQVAEVSPKASDNQYIHSQFGFRYLTIFVTDMNKSLDRAKAAGVPLVAKSPVGLPKGFPEGVYLTLIRDPDGNLVELVGPKGK